jgi:capsular polysaccharide transport system permease protein
MEAYEAKIHRQSAWEIQRSVVFGIFIRELENRFGRYALGYLWAPLEPLLFVIVLSLVRGRFAAGDIGGISPVVFFATGVLAYIFFRQVPLTSLSCVESNQGLFNYQRVKPADIFVARFILESLIIIFVALLLFPILLNVGQEFMIHDPLRLFAVLATFLMFVAGLGLACTALGPLWIESKKVLPLFIRPLFFLSGVFFPLVSVPVGLRGYLTWNPLLHALELIRDAAFVGYNLAPEISFPFLFWCAIISFALGLSIYRLMRIKIVTSGTIR